MAIVKEYEVGLGVQKILNKMIEVQAIFDRGEEAIEKECQKVYLDGVHVATIPNDDAAIFEATTGKSLEKAAEEYLISLTRKKTVEAGLKKLQKDFGANLPFAVGQELAIMLCKHD